MKLDSSRELRAAKDFARSKGFDQDLELIRFYPGRDGFVFQFGSGTRSRTDFESHIFVPQGDLPVFQYPDDPVLDLFSSFVQPERLKSIAGQLFPESPIVRTSLLSYRPMRRAIIKLELAEQNHFIRVLRPKKVGSIVQTHLDLLAAGISVPEVSWWSESGVMVTHEIKGETLHEAAPTMQPVEVFRLWEAARQMLDGVSSKTLRSNSLEQCEWMFQPLHLLYPENAKQLQVLEANLKAKQDLGQAGETVVSRHGDLHLGQIILDPSQVQVRGILDIDTFGLGSPADDFAALASQLIRLERDPAKLLEWRSLLNTAAQDRGARFWREFRLRTAVQLALMALSYDAFESGAGVTLIGEAVLLSELGDYPKTFARDEI